MDGPESKAVHDLIVRTESLNDNDPAPANQQQASAVVSTPTTATSVMASVILPVELSEVVSPTQVEQQPLTNTTTVTSAIFSNTVDDVRPARKPATDDSLVPPSPLSIECQLEIQGQVSDFYLYGYHFITISSIIQLQLRGLAVFIFYHMYWICKHTLPCDHNHFSEIWNYRGLQLRI